MADHSQSASHMETTMKLLKTRVQSRLALHKQFASLGKLGQGLGPDSHSGNIRTETISFSSELVNPHYRSKTPVSKRPVFLALLGLTGRARGGELQAHLVRGLSSL